MNNLDVLYIISLSLRLCYQFKSMMTVKALNKLKGGTFKVKTITMQEKCDSLIVTVTSVSQHSH